MDWQGSSLDTNGRRRGGCRWRVENMNVVRCSHCGETCRVPLGLAEGARVRCPWCGETDDADAVLAQLPPEFEVVETESGEADVADSTSRAFAELAALAESPDPEAVEGLDRIAAGGDEDGEGGGGFPVLADTNGNLGSGAVRGARSTTVERGKNLEILKIVGGAVLAIPAAAMILLWLPGSWQRDPLGIGPTLGRYVPWIVPSNFRAAAEEESTDDGDSDSVSTGSADALPRLPSMNSSDNNPSSQASPGRAPRKAKSEGATKTGTAAAGSHHRKLADTRVGNADRGGSSEQRKTPKVAKKNPGRARKKTTVPDTDTDTSPMAMDDGDVLGVYNSPRFDVADFERALSAAESAWDSWHTLAADAQLDDTVRDRVRDQLLDALYELGEITVYVDPESARIPELAKRAGALLEALAGAPKLLAVIGNRAGRHLSDPKRARNGILLFGTVARIGPRGNMFETKINLASRQQQQATILTYVDPEQHYRKGARVLLLGAVVDQPAFRVAGYDGNAPRAVIGGVPAVVPSR